MVITSVLGDGLGGSYLLILGYHGVLFGYMRESGRTYMDIVWLLFKPQALIWCACWLWKEEEEERE